MEKQVIIINTLREHYDIDDVERTMTAGELIECLQQYDEDANIEYVRTDVFIEKAVKWIEEINNHHHIMRYSDSCEPPLSELTEWFKNYIKGE